VVASRARSATLAGRNARRPRTLVRAHSTGGEGTALSTQPADYERRAPSPVRESRPAEAVAGFLAAASIALSFVAMIEKPVRLAPFALIVAFIAVAIGGRHQRLASAAVVIGILGWVVGMTVAISTENPLY
jgi:hypothetical protein